MNTVPLPQDVKRNLDVLLANLMGERNRLKEMGSKKSITPEMLTPHPSLKFEREVLSAVYMCEEGNVPPTVENVSLYMHKPDEKTKEQLRELQALGDGEKGYILPYSMFIHQSLMQHRMAVAGTQVAELLGTPHLDLSKPYNEALDLLQQARPNDMKNQAMGELEAWDDFFAYNEYRVQRVDAGLSLGATFPLEKMRDMVSVLGEGDMTLITGMPKIGKTTSVLEFSEHFQKDDADVVIFWMETSPKRIRERKLARRFKIPGKALKHGKINFNKAPWSGMKDTIKEEQRELWNTKGRIYNVYCPGAMLEEITALMYYYSKLAEARNRPLVCILDYLQVIGKPQRKTDYEALSYNATTLKDHAGINNCHVILFSQESTDTNAKSKGDSKSYGTTIPIQRAQIHIAIERILADKTVEMVSEDGEYLMDAMNKKRVWQYEDKWASLYRYNILRANDDDSGKAYAMLENPLFKVADISGSIEDPAKRARLPQFIQDDLKRFEVLDRATRRMRTNT